MSLAETEHKFMDEMVIGKTWEVLTHGGKGPVTVTLRLPEVKITDSEGRHIVISPEQTEIVASKLENIACWIDEGPGE